MELTDLKVFVAIAEEGGISRAAERLDYVQSNVTARLRKLEEELGVSLFHRLPKGVALTEKGMVFREYAVQILHLSEEAAKAVQETDEPNGSLTIGVVETVTCGHFMQILSDYQARYPHVTLTLVTGQSFELLEKLLNHQLDGAFLIGEIQSTKLIVEYQEKDELKWLGQQKEAATPDLSAVKWAVSPKGCPFRNILEEWLRSEGITSIPVIEISSLETLLSCVRSGLASTLLPASVLTGGYEQLSAYSIPEKFRRTTTSLVRRQSRFSHKAFQAFADMVRMSGL
ncbi:LysR family transcriptional regulator [Paenibacillus piri]|uniref:LysR family transcriptional regulator n=1 Tax=Paenibacillus piri TaxID=2547395 RepID=A0A4R5KJ18_9BACL|nr:LysR family transcriptional regulator [Paenibacillus piri]TDF94775.1 LysR family transcriptional regulator [Paenibacillus piri]